MDTDDKAIYEIEGATCTETLSQKNPLSLHSANELPREYCLVSILTTICAVCMFQSKYEWRKLFCSVNNLSFKYRSINRSSSNNTTILCQLLLSY